MRNFRINSQTWEIHIWSRYCTLYLGLKSPVNGEGKLTTHDVVNRTLFQQLNQESFRSEKGTLQNCAMMFLSSAMRRMSFPLHPGESFYASADAEKAFADVESVRKKGNEENLHNFA